MIKINRLQKYFFNATIISIGGIILQALSVIFNVFVSWKIGAEAMGLFTLCGGVYGFAITIATSGINLAVVRLVSSVLPYNEKNDLLDKNSHTCVYKVMKSATIYALSFSFLATILLLSLSKPIGLYLLNDIRVVPSLRLMAFSLIPISISSMINGYFCAVRRAYKNVIVQFFEKGIKFTIITLLLVAIAPIGIEYACLSLSIGGLISELSSLALNIILYFFDRKRHQNKLDSSKNEPRSFSVFSAAFPLAVSAYVRSGLSTIENLAIPWGLRKSGLGVSSALASYGVLHGMVFPLIFFPSSILGAFSSLLVPEIASSYEAKDFARIKRIVSYVFSFSLLFSLGVSGIFISLSNKIGIFFFGSYEAGNFIRLLSPLIPLIYLDFAVDALLKGLGEHVYSMRVNIIDSFISVILILLLVPAFGINGYIGIIFITELLNTSLSIIKLLNKTGVKPEIFKWIFKPTINIILSTFLSRLIFSVFPALTSGKINTILEILLCTLLYLLFSSITGTISKKEIGLLKAKANQKS